MPKTDMQDAADSIQQNVLSASRIGELSPKLASPYNQWQLQELQGKNYTMLRSVDYLFPGSFGDIHSNVRQIQVPD